MQIYLVGGAVRDGLLNLPVSEKDWVVVGASPQELLDAGFKQVGRDFPVFLHPQSKEEYALARTERKTGKGYTGFECFAGADVSLEEDLKRRDLTINAMAQDDSGAIIDPYGGRQDIEAKLLRHVSPAFEEDPLRIVRVARFAARYRHLGFQIAAETMHLMRSMVARQELDELVPERVWQEISRALCESQPQVFFTVLSQCKGLEQLIPPFADGALLQRSLDVLRNAVDLQAPLAVRCASLLRHLDAKSAGQFCRRMKVPKAVQDLVLLAIENCGSVHDLPDASAGKILSLLEDLDAFRRARRFQDFLLVCAADGGSETAPDPVSLLRNYHQAAMQVSAEDVDETLQGKAVGAAIQRRRAAVIQQIIEGQAGS
ncbi:MAG: multifunctional CCA tRNA nucleotidyl transferase/2'3'-cyclic phosphodiesterase/2'nucleotidase/phosphatase [Pseudomonadales bacterium]|jgi:tRNA nucleotidyltransferase (CCA-adding enzyme)|nr:multifunctional CCA tRNA nucleotidyl transferase/2'3'-cyclic phosphodiesterase/2'nucleotidase/phosphatase [Pseudomonadales bacterium]MDP7360670.1 multifunctional CCA tRNA nucleotidyl transferase/2'3'-cyclic phosphodiesterase/2'nucleotidase/phosphatase [Pseudomonadales bacterium]MDP7597989.1 multifunctional CCA tRNA nucleotidyl transferase/2'3'-cyclic phosphodiesterase/2'nucleotidase/phosphatase [Pseudomonadales bacterium]HJN52632.1 multifunctional CCA tRNA nucleotidyl transferase/2'3'-cyclic |tara:strand:- start:873 stop:1991 length:1119 start_codon:yes stop_codon:yes gene_type:complete